MIVHNKPFKLHLESTILKLHESKNDSFLAEIADKDVRYLLTDVVKTTNWQNLMANEIDKWREWLEKRDIRDKELISQFLSAIENANNKNNKEGIFSCIINYFNKNKRISTPHATSNNTSENTKKQNDMSVSSTQEYDYLSRSVPRVREPFASLDAAHHHIHTDREQRQQKQAARHRRERAMRESNLVKNPENHSHKFEWIPSVGLSLSEKKNNDENIRDSYLVKNPENHSQKFEWKLSVGMSLSEKKNNDENIRDSYLVKNPEKFYNATYEPSPLPFGWRQLVDPTTGHTYYANYQLRTTTWERPLPDPKSTNDDKTKLNKELLKAAIEGDVDAQDHEGWTALHVASLRGREKVVTELLENGADVDAKDKEGLTALHLASGLDRLHIVELLLEAGANIKAKDIFGETALHKASKFGYKDVARLLQNAGAK